MNDIRCVQCDSAYVQCLNDVYALYRCEECGERFSEEDIVDSKAAMRRSRLRRQDEEYDYD